MCLYLFKIFGESSVFFVCFDQKPLISKHLSVTVRIHVTFSLYLCYVIEASHLDLHFITQIFRKVYWILLLTFVKPTLYVLKFSCTKSKIFLGS